MSNTTLRYDLQTKAALYARHGIRELWVIDLGGAKVHLFRGPTRGAYSETATKEPTSVTLHAMPEVSVDLSVLFESERRK